MRLGEKQPAATEGNVGESSTSIRDLANVPEVLGLRCAELTTFNMV
jgi:hypothetical protein